MRAGKDPAVAVALLAGVCGAVQPRINADLGQRVGSGLVASMVNFAAALMVVVVAVAARPRTLRLLLRLRSWPVPRWTMSAGLAGALIVLSGVVSVDTIGVAVFSVAFFAGQIAFGLLVDHVGVGPGGKRPLSSVRLQAVVLSLAAVAVAQLGRARGELALALVALVVAAGAASAFQSAFNARIAVATGDPIAATAVNVVVGFAALLVAAGSATAVAPLASPRWPSEPWLYTGGVLGVTVVLSLAVASAALGVLRATVAMLAAQMVAALAVDWLVEGEPPGPAVVAGALLIIVAVARLGRQVGPAATVETT